MDMQDLQEQIQGLKNIKAFYMEKVQTFEARASALELTILERDTQILESERRESSLGNKLKSQT